MKRSLRLVLATAVVLVLVGAYLLLSRDDAAGTTSSGPPVTEDAASTAQEDTSGPAVLMDIDREEVRTVELIGRTRRLTLQRTEVPQPSQDGANAGDGGTGAEDAAAETEIRFLPDYPVELDLRDGAVERLIRNARSLRARRTMAEDVEDLAAYGLDEATASVVRVTPMDGAVRELLIGRELPSGEGYYARRRGARSVHAISSGNAEPLLWRLDDLRDRSLPGIEPGRVERLRLVTPETGIRTVPLDAQAEPLLAMFSSQKLTEPYRVERPASPDGLSKYLQNLPSFRIVRFVEDKPEDLAVYGLADPRFELDVSDAAGSRLHLLFGNRAGSAAGDTAGADTAEEDEGGLYAKRPNEPKVFVTNVDAETLAEDPFTFVSKFVLIVDIRNVRSFEVQAHDAGETFRSRIERSPSESADEEPAETFYFEGVQAEEDPFRQLYQAVIGLTFDAARPEPVTGTPPPGERVLTVRYQVENLPASELAAHLTEYDRNFYAVHRDGVSEFLIAKAQVRKMLEQLRRSRKQIAATADTGSD